MKKRPPPAAELELLACLQRLKEATAAQLREAMETHRPMAHGSVVTLLKRLQLKKLVKRKKGPVGKAFIYSLTQQRASVFQGALRDMVQRVFHGNGAALVASLFETQPPSPEEIEQIQMMLTELRRKASSQGERQ